MNEKYEIVDGKLQEFSVVDNPAQEPAVITITKNQTKEDSMKDSETKEVEKEEVKAEAQETEKKEEVKAEAKETEKVEAKEETAEKAVETSTVTKADFDALVEKNAKLEKRLEDERVEKRAREEFSDLPTTVEVAKAMIVAFEGIENEESRKAAFEFLGNSQKADMRVLNGTSISKSHTDSATGDLMEEINKLKEANKGMTTEQATKRLARENPALVNAGIGI